MTKETLEFLEAIEVSSVAIAKIAKDKKVNLEDLPVLIEVATKFETLAKGFAGVSDVPSELKSASQEEVIAIIAKLYSIANKVKAELN